MCAHVTDSDMGENCARRCATAVAETGLGEPLVGPLVDPQGYPWGYPPGGHVRILSFYQPQNLSQGLTREPQKRPQGVLGAGQVRTPTTPCRSLSQRQVRDRTRLHTFCTLCAKMRREQCTPILANSQNSRILHVQKPPWGDPPGWDPLGGPLGLPKAFRLP